MVSDLSELRDPQAAASPPFPVMEFVLQAAAFSLSHKRLAKASLGHNCKNPLFKKLFPEHVERYNQQLQNSKQVVSEQTLSRRETSKFGGPTTVVVNGTNVEGKDREEIANDGRNRSRTKKFSFWLLLLLASVFGIVMALPLLQP
ncbi:hypothetical protein H6P81_010904 [Aristolochia fimbriata]|uniref:Uncharacterized protein n=1 Tax=Aristolochia fimbriata TaxID=158543 RepID=A0AAV7ER92_ARIFI|nr:hypothetical protein H6P81_010904 [Aristolochia fimbriata]